MSKPLITASGATVMFAVNWVEPLNVVEFTVTPPGFVVPVTNHWAWAPFWNPFPVMAMSRFMVPWGAALGLAESTWIWAVAGNALTPANNARTTKNTDEQRLGLICSPQEEMVSGRPHASAEFLLRLHYTDSRSVFPNLICRPYHHKRGPVIGISVADVTLSYLALRPGQCRSTPILMQVPVKPGHEGSRGFIIDRPQTGQNTVTSRTEKSPRHTYELVPSGHFREIALAERCFTGAQGNQASSQLHMHNLVELKTPVVFPVGFEF